MASAAGGMFLFQTTDQYVTLTDKQRKTFTACFFKKMLHDEALRKAKEEAEAKQHQLSKDNLRKNKIRIHKDKMKKSLHNQRVIQVLLKLKYHLEDSYGCYDFLGQDLTAEGEVNSALGFLFALNQEKACKLFLGK